MHILKFLIAYLNEILVINFRALLMTYDHYVVKYKYVNCILGNLQYNRFISYYIQYNYCLLHLLRYIYWLLRNMHHTSKKGKYGVLPTKQMVLESFFLKYNNIF